MTQQEIEAQALELYPERKRQNKNGTGEYDANLPRRKAYIKGWTDTQPTGELKNIQMDGSALKINIQFKIKPQNPKEL